MVYYGLCCYVHQIQYFKTGMRDTNHIILLVILAISTSAVQIPLQLGDITCTAIISSFDPIKVDIRLPAVKGKVEDESYKISITSVATDQIAYETYVAPESVFRKSIDLKQRVDILYELCITFESQRSFSEEEVVYIPYTQAEDFEGLINHIEIPPELAKQENLKKIFETSKKIQGVSRVIASHQGKERELEDQIVINNIHKTQRIMTISLIECLVIILSGVYQICALRKFLIEKNLY